MDTRRLRFRSAACLAAVLACGNAAAQTEPNAISRFTLTPFAGYSFGGEFKDDDEALAVEIDDAAHFGLVFDLREGANTQWEVFYARQSADADTAEISPGGPAVDLDIQYLQVGGTYVADGQRARPFLAATLGGTRFDPDPLSFDSETFFSFGVGAGWYVTATDRLSFRLEGRLLGTLVSSDSELFCETGPDENVCAIAADGDVFWQFQTSAGFALRF